LQLDEVYTTQKHTHTHTCMGALAPPKAVARAPWLINCKLTHVYTHIHITHHNTTKYTHTDTHTQQNTCTHKTYTHAYTYTHARTCRWASAPPKAVARAPWLICCKLTPVYPHTYTIHNTILQSIHTQTRTHNKTHAHTQNIHTCLHIHTRTHV